MARDSWIDAGTEPKGKRTTRRDQYGILIGYIGRTRWERFDHSDASRDQEEARAAAWRQGHPDWQNADLH